MTVKWHMAAKTVNSFTSRANSSCTCALDKRAILNAEGLHFSAFHIPNEIVQG